jgi:hypothetical protein
MKKIAIIFVIACITLSSTAQQAVRIGNMEIIVRKQDQDTTVQINVLEDPEHSNISGEKQSSASRYRSFTPYRKHLTLMGLGFMVPQSGSDYYNINAGNSFNFDFGWMRRQHFARRFAYGRTLAYSFNNYNFGGNDRMNFHNRISDEQLTDIDDFKKFNKQVFRSHNVALELFMRFYIVPPKGRSRDEGLYIDLGAQGDFAFSKYYMTKQSNGGKDKYRNESFNPLNASAIARIQWGRGILFKDNSSLFVRYRFTDAFKKDLNMDLPPITIGVHWQLNN